jgi:hypothetical protein
MAIGLMTKVRGAGLDVYDAVNERLDPEGEPPQGLLVHTAAAAPDGGFDIYEVWESRAAQERFVEERLGPAIQAVAGEDAPQLDLTEWQLHNFFTGS